MIKNRKLHVSLIAMLAVIGMAAACTPPAAGGGLPKKDWSFRGTQVKVVNSQDCVVFVNCKDEPYLLNIGFRVKMGKSNSAQAWVVNNRNDSPQDVSPGSTVQVTGAGSPVIFNGVKPVDVLDLANTSNKLEIMGTYTWASEQDFVGNGVAANGVADFLQDALNETLAKASLTDFDASVILDIVLDNIGSALGILIQNVPLLGFGDDVLGGALYIGIGAHGTLGSALNGLLSGVTVPTVDLPPGIVPPRIVGGGLYTMTGSKTFNQTFTGGSGVDGKHEWTMLAGPA
ncbi:MAG TPA: hypothetical protein VL068_09490 [Microthrixaceae bacterium]|nr:hypothetical protein [Microthrixaceae bacterium]